MAQDNFLINLIAGLHKSKSKAQIKEDIKSLGDIYLKLIGNLHIPKTRSAINKQIKNINPTININPKINTKNINTAAQQAAKQATATAQQTANKNPVRINFDVDKKKLVNQIRILGQQNSKLFNDRDMTIKYSRLLNSANAAKTTQDLKNLRGQLSAFKTELIATGNAGLNISDKFAQSIKRYASFFSGASFIYALANQIRNAENEAKTLDDRLVDLQKVTDEIADRNSLYKYFDRAMSKAQEMNVKVDDLLYSIAEFKKLGYSLSDAEIGGEWATKLANVGDLNIDTAIGSIKTAIASFDEIGGYGNDQLDKKMEAYSDLINEMSNKYSIDAEGLAEAIRISAGTLTEAHTTVEQAAAMFATANRYYNDPNYLGNVAKIGSLRLRASAADKDAIKELQEMGEETDDLIESTSKLREQMLALTGVDIMVDEHTFKGFYDQLKEISEVIDDLSDTSRAQVVETLFGKNRAAGGAALISGLKDCAEAYETAINSAGSATKEYETWMQSADAASQKFANNLTKTYQSIINGNTVHDLYNLGSAVLEFANNWGIVEGTLKGLLVLGVGKFITGLGTMLISATKRVEQYGKALQMAQSVQSGGNLQQKFAQIKQLAQATIGLTDAQLKNVLASKNLSQQDRIRILQLQGLSQAEAQARLNELGLIQATTAQTAANAGATASTFSLKAAMTGLGATIRNVFLSNPVGIALMGISLAVSAITSAVSKHNQELEEARQKAKELADKSNELGDSVAELTHKYLSLSEAVKTDKSQKDLLMQTQDELLKKLQLEGDTIDTLIEKYGSLDEAIKQVSVNSLRDARIDLIGGVRSAEEELKKIGKGYAHWYSLKDRNLISGAGDDAVRAFQALEEAGVVSRDSYGTGGGSLILTGGDAVEGILENYEKLNDTLRVLEQTFTSEELTQNDLYEAILNRRNAMREAVESYTTSIKELNENVAQDITISALKGNELPKTVEEFEVFKQGLIDTALASEEFRKEFIGTEEDMTNAINGYLSSIPEFSGFLSVPLEEELDKVDALLSQDHFSFSLSDEQSKLIDDYQSNLSKLQKALEQIRDGSWETSSFMDLVQDFNELQGGSDNLEQAIIDLIDKLQSDLYKSFGTSLPDDLRASLNATTNAAKGITMSLNDAFSNVQKSYKALHDFKDAMSNDGLTDSILSSVSGLSTELNNLVAGFYAGTISSDKLYSALKDHYDNDLRNYSEALIKKNELNVEFCDSLGLNSSDVTNQFNKDYGIDLENCKTYNQKKLQIEQETLGKLSRMWAVYYDAESMAYNEKWTQLEEAAIGNDPTAGEEYYAIKKQIERYEEAVNALNKIAYNGIESSFSGISNSLDKNGSPSSSNNKFDWISNSIENLTTKLSRLDAELENETSIDKRIKKLKKIVAVNKELESTYSQAAKAYEAEWKKAGKGLSEQEKADIRSGKVFRIEDFSGDAGQKHYNQIVEAQKAYQQWQKIIIDLEKQHKEVLEAEAAVFQPKIDEAESMLSIIDKKLDDTSNLKERISLEKSRKEWIKQEYDAKIKQAKLTGTELEVEKLRIEKAEKLAEIQRNIVQYKIDDKETTVSMYGAMISATTDLHEQLVLENKKRKAIRDEYDLKIQLAKLEGKTAEATQLQYEKEKKMVELYKEKFDLVQKQYENELSLIDDRAKVVSATMSLYEARGKQLGESFYVQQIAIENANINKMAEERSALMDKLNSIQFGTSEWYDAVKTINDLTVAIINSESSVANFEKAIRDLKFDNIKRLQNAIGDIADEAGFLKELLSYDELFDDDGKYTDSGLATLGMMTTNFDTYMAKADGYAKALQELDSMYDDKNSQEYLERRQELIQAQRDSILSAQKEKKAIIDLVKEAREKEIDALKKEIDAKKKLLDEEKDLYEFNKKIADQRKHIADLEKQIEALSGDDSDENKKKLRGLRDSLAKAKEALEGDLRDKSIEDQKASLDTMLENSQTQMDEYFKDTSKVFADALSLVNSNTNNIGNAINQVATDVGYTISSTITDAWRQAGNAVTDYHSTFMSQSAGIIQQIGGIQVAWSMAGAAAEEAALKELAALDAYTQIVSQTGSTVPDPNDNGSSQEENKTDELIDAIEENTQAIQDQRNNGEPVTSEPQAQPTPPTPSTSNSNSASGTNANTDKPSNSNNKKWGYWFVSRKYTDDRSKLDVDGSLVDRLKSLNIDADFEKRKKYYEAMGFGKASSYTGTSAQNVKMLNAMKKNGYKYGTPSATAGYHLFDEEGLGSELILTKEGVLSQFKGGERVFTKDMADNLWNLASLKMKPIVPDYSAMRREAPNINIDISTNVDGVATNEIVSQMTGVARKQAENVIAEINRQAYNKGARWR